jgi:hypothetical protein
MSVSEIDYLAFFLLLLKYLLQFVALYVIILLVLRMSKYYKISNCPNCAGELKRSQRKGSDRLINSLSFGILPIKRYRCYTCYWEGQALEVKTQDKRYDSENQGSSN